ncbi:NAD(P)/FAD-dependent oxidoreductase [Propionibacteriaceae bacterium G57]|uniref:NAD(P)/FAD-dependent oxidoreductase n=1 Tax=Aestuariimicrobium sp. G57 TaxID=3418485 RepID=UPI003DA79F6F
MTTHQPSPPWDVIVVGGSAAGLSTALMLGRARRRVLVVDAGQPRNRFAEHMHGVLGHEGRSPGDLVRQGRDECTGYGVEFVHGTATHVTDEAADGLLVGINTADGERRERTRALVLATGITDQLAPVPGLAAHWGTDVLHCPYCHGWEVRDQRLGVLAVSPMSLHQAHMVRQWSDDVVLFSAAAGELDTAERARLAARGVEVVESPAAEVLAEGGRITGVRTHDGRTVAIDALFTFGLPIPHDDCVADLGLTRAEMPGLGSFIAVDPSGHTSHERIWAAGNVVNPMANVPVAMAAGAMAGAVANGWLVDQDFELAGA